MNKKITLVRHLILVTLLVMLIASITFSPVTADKTETEFSYVTFNCAPVPNTNGWHLIVTGINWEGYPNAKYLRMGALNTIGGVTTEIFVSSIEISSRSHPYPQDQTLDGFTYGTLGIPGSQFTPYIELVGASGKVLIRVMGPITYSFQIN